MKRYLNFYTTLIAIILCSMKLHAQINLTITNTDVTQYPNNKIYFKVTDAGGNRIDTFSPSEFTVTENGIDRPVISVNCPPPPPQSVSLTLTFDISYSMTGGNRMPNSKSAATTLINQFNFPPAECGITTFSDNAAVFLPYTSDKNSVLTAINNLSASGNGTDLYKGFMDPVAGAIPFTSSRTGKRAIVFLTDAYEILSTAEVNQIIAAANANNIAIYTVLVITNPPPPMPFRTIATQTGGKWYEGVVTEQQAKDVYKQIAIDILNPPPCELTYLSSGCDLSRTGTLSLTKLSTTVQQNFVLNIPVASMPRISSDKIYVEYGIVKPPAWKDLNVTITARNKNITIQSITTDKSQFYVTSYGGSAPPFTLANNQSRILTIRFAPSDSFRIIGSLIITSDAPCNAEVILAGGKLKPPTLKVVQPNGGEQLSIGSNYQILWTGVLSQEQVSIEYTTDAGNIWSTISMYGTGLVENWLVPNTPSTQCLMRVTSSDSRTSGSDKMYLPLNNDKVLTVAFSNDGSVVASGGNDRNVKIWRADNGSPIQTIAAHTGAVKSIAFNQDSGWFATASADRTVKIWRLSDASLMQTITQHAYPVHTVFVSADGSHFLTSDERDIKLWNVPGFSLDWNVSGFSDVNGAAVMNNQGTLIASVKGNNAYILDSKNGNPLRTLTGHSAKVRSVSFSPDGMLIATGSDDKTVRIWRVSDGTSLKVYNGHSAEVYSVMFSYDGSVVLSGSYDRTLKIWRLINDQLVATLSGHTDGINDVAFSPDRTLIASGSNDNTVRIWGYKASMSDMSDSLWTIMSANATISSTQPNFKNLICEYETYTDTTIDVMNSGNKTLTITASDIVGPDSTDFELISPVIPPDLSILPGQKQKFTIRFQPTAIGTRSALLRLTSNAMNAPTYDITLQGVKDSVGISLSSSSIDFGETYHCTSPSQKNILLKNTGTLPLTINQLSFDSTDGFSIVSPSVPITIDADRDTTVVIQFAPSTEKLFQTLLRVQGLQCNIQPVINLSGSRVSSLPQISNSRIDFGSVSVGFDTLQSFSIYNKTKSIMVVDTLIFNPPNADITFVNAVPFPIQIKPSDSLVLQLQFAPTKEQVVSGSMNIKTSAPCSDSVAVSLIGNSTTLPVITTTTPTFKTLICPTDTVTTAEVIIRNDGGQILYIFDAYADSILINDFELIKPTKFLPPLGIPPNKSDTFIVQFKPTAFGKRTTRLKIESNSYKDAYHNVPLEATKEFIDLALTPDTIDFGDVYECTPQPVQTVTLKNNSTIPLQFDRVFIENQNDFSILDSFPSSINVSSSVTFRISFNQNQNGVYNTKLHVKMSPCNLEKIFPVRATRILSKPTLSVTNIDFGTVGVGRSLIKEFTITNQSSTPILIDSYAFSPAINKLTIVLPAFPFVIPPSGTQRVRINYAPLTRDTINAQFLLYQIQPCKNTLAVQLNGFGVQATANISLPTISAHIGDVIQIPITLSNAQYFVEAGVQSFSSTIQYNRTMLWLQKILVQNGDSATISFVSNNGSLSQLNFVVNNIAIPSNGVIANIEFLVMLGNAEQTPLTFTDFIWLNGLVATNLQNGLFTAEGICRAGGSRLVNAPSSLTLWQNSPNPFNPQTTIEYFLPIKTNARLEIYNALGKLVEVLVDEEQKEGLHSVVFDASKNNSLQSGIYFYKLTALEQVLIKRMVYVK